MQDRIQFSEDDREHFKAWLELNLNSITWEGRHLKDFNIFWNNLFLVNSDIHIQFEMMSKVIRLIKEGPLLMWFKWLQSKLVCYLFLYKVMTVEQLADSTSMKPEYIALILRDFFIERFPHLEDQINTKFILSNKLSENMKMDYEQLSKELKITGHIRGSSEDEVLSNLEITLYGEWEKILKFLQEFRINKRSRSLDYIQKFAIDKQIKFIQELVVLFTIGGLLIFLVKLGNKKYNEYLVKEISLFEPNFFWLNKNISFQRDSIFDTKSIDLSSNELDQLEKIENKESFDTGQDIKRYEVESDVVLTSVETLPKDLEVANLEQSNYEEIKKGGYRNVRYGRRKAYRVMMTSVSPQMTKEEISKILGKYDVKQVDNVKPGTSIPGGIYFNLYVPSKHLKEFLSKVSKSESATILESKTHFSGPKNSNKVFIWIKSI